MAYHAQRVHSSFTPEGSAASYILNGLPAQPGAPFADPRLNTQPTIYPALTPDVEAGDPFTPLLRAYEDDRVQIRILVGAHEEGHNFGVHSINWKFEPGTPEDPAANANNNTGFRNNQMMGISEHYEFVVPKLPRKYDGKTADYLYSPGNSVDDQWNGLWGLMRVFAQRKINLMELPNNLKKNTLGYTNQGGRLHDPTAIMFVRTNDLDPATGKLKAGTPVEPLVLRAKAGDCIKAEKHISPPFASSEFRGRV